MKKPVFGTALLVLLAVSLLSALSLPVTATSHPRNYTEALIAGFKGIVEPDNPIVLQKLQTLCPIIDEEHFTENLLAVYKYAMLIPYAYDSKVYGRDYWQTSEETITLAQGDCEDQAINLATLIEALYKQTYGYIPLNLVWVVIGYIKTTWGEGGHGWVIINEGLIPEINQIRSLSISEAQIDVVLGGTGNSSDTVNEVKVSLDLADLPSKTDRQLSILYIGERYSELEPTWDLPMSEFFYKQYPYTEVWAIFNSQTYELNPDFYRAEPSPVTETEIKNIAFSKKVAIGSTYTVNVTVQNYECGWVGADLVVIIKRDGVETTRQNAFVFKYFWQVHTFVFTFSAVEPAGYRNFSAELYFHDGIQMILKDSKNFTLEAILDKPDLVPFSLSAVPKDVSEGNSVVFNVQGQNMGTKTATSLTVDVLVDNQPFDSLLVGNCSAGYGFETQTKPWTAVAGTHSLLVRFDSANSISEINETNNELVASFIVTGLPPSPTPSPTPTATPTPTPKPNPTSTPNPTDTPTTSTPTPNPSESPSPVVSPTQSPEHPEVFTNVLPQEAFYPLAIIGVASAIAITIVSIKKQKK